MATVSTKRRQFEIRVVHQLRGHPAWVRSFLLSDFSQLVAWKREVCLGMRRRLVFLPKAARALSPMPQEWGEAPLRTVGQLAEHLHHSILVS